MSKMVTVDGKSFDCYLENWQLKERIEELGKQITIDYSGFDLHLLIVLNGAYRFGADLSGCIDLPIKVSFVRLSSYLGTRSSGEVTVDEVRDLHLQGKDVLIVEDIVDTGTTLEFLLTLDAIQAAKSVKIASLLFKPTAYKKEFKLNYIGFEIPDLFVIGYGLDYNGLGRNLNDIYQLN